MSFTQLLKKIINTSVGKTNFWLATIGMGLSLLLILIAVQLKYNFEQLQGNNTQYIVISKEITTDMMRDINKSSFAKSEIEDLRKTGFFDSIQGIKTSLFKVKLDVPMNTIPLNTDMYFESVPDAYLDMVPADWKWQKGKGAIKAVAPRFLLDMYNYGFAVGQNLPQLSEDFIGQIPLNFTIGNADGTQELVFKGNIGGLSDRFASILVPESFMDWANATFGTAIEKPATRVVAKAKDPSSSEMNAYLKKRGMKTDFGEGRYSILTTYVGWAQTAIKVIGIIFFGFALLVFLMFIQLTVVNAKQEIHLLTTLGTSPKQLEGFLLKKLMPVYVVIIGVILIALSTVQFILATHPTLVKKAVVLPKIMPYQVFVAAAIILVFLWIVNYFTVKKYIKQNL
jgi:hypothetical protein